MNVAKNHIDNENDDEQPASAPRPKCGLHQEQAALVESLTQLVVNISRMNRTEDLEAVREDIIDALSMARDINETIEQEQETDEGNGPTPTKLQLADMAGDAEAAAKSTRAAFEAFEALLLLPGTVRLGVDQGTLNHELVQLGGQLVGIREAVESLLVSIKGTKTGGAL